MIDIERLARALHEANVDCDYSRKFDRKSCASDDGPHAILAKSIARAYDEPPARIGQTVETGGRQVVPVTSGQERSA